MPLKEKTAQIYLTFIFISLGYSRKLVLIPFILDIKIKNQFLLDTISLLFEPINLMLTPLGYLAATSGQMIIFFGLLVFIIGFFLFTIESFLLSKIIIFIFKKAAPENFFEKFYSIVGKKMSGGHSNSFNVGRENYDKFQKIKYYFPVLIFIILLVILYPAISSLTDKKKEDAEKQGGNYTNYNELDDSDKDSLPDYIEKILGTNKNDPDTDGDGYNDFDEIKNSYDPLSDKKYTQEEYEVVKEKIKNKDEGFYKNNFIVDKIKILLPGECNLPDKISNYTLKDSQYFVIKPEDAKFFLKGAVSKTTISYAAYSSFNAEITITSFDSANNVSIAMQTFKNKYSFSECEIAKIKGLCSLLSIPYAEFIWQDFDMLKIIKIDTLEVLKKLQKEDKKVDSSEIEKKALDDLTLFIPIIENCKIENK